MTNSINSAHIVVIDRSEDLLSLLISDFPNCFVHLLNPASTLQVQDCDLPEADVVVLNHPVLEERGQDLAKAVAERLVDSNPDCSVVSLLSPDFEEDWVDQWDIAAEVLIIDRPENVSPVIKDILGRNRRTESWDHLRKENRRLKKEIRDLEAVGEVSRSITSTLLIEEILTEILSGIRQVLGLEQVLLGLVNSDRQVEEIKVSIGVFDTGPDLKWTISTEDPVWKWILEERKPLLLDASATLSLPSFLRQIFAGEFVKVPMVIKDQIIGTIMGSRTTSPLDQRDLKLFQIFVQYAGIALENGRLYYDVIRSEEELKKAQEKLLATEKLALIGQLSISISHEINNPLCNISLINQILKQELKNRAPDLLKRLNGIDESVARIQQVTERIARIKNTNITEYLPDQMMIDLK